MEQEWNQKHVQILVMIQMKRINVANVSSFIKEAEREVERRKYRVTVDRNTEGTGNKRVFRLTVMQLFSHSRLRSVGSIDRKVPLYL